MRIYVPSGAIRFVISIRSVHERNDESDLVIMLLSQAALWFGLLFGVLASFIAGGCSRGGVVMYAANKFVSAHDLRNIAGSIARKVLPVEVAETLPVPRKDPKEGLVILILYYNEIGPPSRRIVKPPHHAMYLNPATGKVLRFWACDPEELGIETPLKPVLGAGIPAEMPKMEYVEKRQRFLDISPAVWEAFASGATQYPGEVRSMIHDYRSLFLHITKAEVAPFYVEAAPDFFHWLEQVDQGR
jgi:hypothetical protein